MCAGRQKPRNGPFLFVPFTPADLAAVGITPDHVPEDLTGCYTANRRLHHDARADDAALRRLCLKAFVAGRALVDVRRDALAALHDAAAGEGCPARPDPAGCRDTDCVALPAPAAHTEPT